MAKRVFWIFTTFLILTSVYMLIEAKSEYERQQYEFNLNIAALAEQIEFQRPETENEMILHNIIAESFNKYLRKKQNADIFQQIFIPDGVHELDTIMIYYVREW